MNKKYTWVMGFVVLVAILIAGYLLIQTKGNKQTSPAQNTKTTQNIQNAQQTKELLPTNVSLTASGFKPETITIKSGARIVWLNQSGTTGTVNSDNFPTNRLFPFLNLGKFENNQSVSTMFAKSGKFTYHNALKPDQKGTVIVE